MRIASLLPSATEIVYALGIEDDLVAVTFECNEPARARQEKRIIVGGLDTSAMAPADIDRYVRDRLGTGGDLYTLHEDALAELAPDLILTQDLCQVCSVPTGKVRAALDHLGCRSEVLTLDPYSLGEVLDSILTVAAATGSSERGRRLVSDLERRLAAVRLVVEGRPRPRTAVIEWVDPPFGSGHWMPEMVSTAGGEPVAAHPAGRSGPPPGRRSGPSAPRWSWSPRAVSVWTVPQTRHRSWRQSCRGLRSGPSTQTGSSSVPDLGSWTVSRSSPGCCTPSSEIHRRRVAG